MYFIDNKVLLLFWFITIPVLGDDDPIITTPLGKLKGYRLTSRNGRRFMAFSRIPFAKPPLDKLRFQPPEVADSWPGIRDATEENPFCIHLNLFEAQPEVVGIEDCLYLSVYTHNTTSKAPVMIHIHGGGFITGRADLKPLYLMDEELVIVDINYRLGILGFLSFEDNDMPGNQGLKDQVMALQWVQQNIASFGGDPNLVTLIGESAGGYSVYHHIVSPLSRGLFHRAIAESGTSYDLGSLMPPGYVKAQSRKLSGYTNCLFNTTGEIVTCLQMLNASELVLQYIKFRVWQTDPISVFRPVLEPLGPTAFLHDKVKDWSHYSVPLLTGVTSGEGLLRTLTFIRENMDFNWYSEQFYEVGPLSLGYFATSSKPQEVSKKVREFYFSDGNITMDNWFNIVQMYSDAMFTVGGIMGADKHNANVYFYYFDYLGEFTYATNVNKSLIVGPYHTEEMIYIWPTTPQLKGNDLELSKKFIKMWSSFARYGSPVSELNEIHWKPWSKKQHNYLHISNQGLTEEINFAHNRYMLWRSLPYRDNIL